MDEEGLNCSVPVDFLEGSDAGSITPINNPSLISASEVEAKLPTLSGSDRVLALPPSFHESYGSTPLAIPLDVLFESEIMNLDGWAQRPLAITFCPLTTSTLVFDRTAIDGEKFYVSGLRARRGNEDHGGNLVMVDQRGGESLWPQMSLGAICGPDRGNTLNTLPAVEMQWKRWKELYPNTDVAVEKTGSTSKVVAATPKEAIESWNFSTSQGSKAIANGRVLGIPSESRVGGGIGGVALPFETLDDGAPARVVETTVGTEDVVVFWKREAQAAMAFKATSSFFVQNGQIVDNRTQSVWAVDGQAIEGAREGEQLDPLDRAYVADGRAWFDFQPDSEQWKGSQ